MHLWWWSKGGVDLDEKTITSVLLEEVQSLPVPLDALVLVFFFFNFPAIPAQHSPISHNAPSTYNRCEDGAVSSHQSGE